MSEPTSEEYRIERVRSDSGLFVASWQQGDRFPHQIGLFNGDTNKVLLNSVEGTDLDVWPASPPLQQVYQQEISGDPVLLAVGMAGKNHYSMSARLADRDDTVSLKFESACLVKQCEPGTILGNTYQLEPGVFVHARDQGAVLSDSEGGPSLATIEGIDGTTIEISTSKEIRLVPKSGRQSGGLASQKPEQTREPTQWSYLIRMLSER